MLNFILSFMVQGILKQKNRMNLRFFLFHELEEKIIIF